MQTAGRVVGAGAELAAGVQLGEDHLDPGKTGPWFDVDRDAAAVVDDRDAAVGTQCDQDHLTESAQRLVHRVVDDLPQAVHQAAGVGRPDVHRGSLADGLQTLQDKEMPRLVVATLGSGVGSLHLPRLPPVRRRIRTSGRHPRRCRATNVRCRHGGPQDCKAFVTQESWVRDGKREQSEPGWMLTRSKPVSGGHPPDSPQTRFSSKSGSEAYREHPSHRRRRIECRRSL